MEEGEWRECDIAERGCLRGKRAGEEGAKLVQQKELRAGRWESENPGVGGWRHIGKSCMQVDL